MEVEAWEEKGGQLRDSAFNGGASDGGGAVASGIEGEIWKGNIPTKKRFRHGRRSAFHLYHAFRIGDNGCVDILYMDVC